MAHPVKKDRLREQSIQGGVWAAVSSVGASVVGFLSFLVLSRLLGPDIYGLMAMAEAAFALGLRLLSSGLEEPLVQFQDLDPEHADTLFWTLQGLGLAMAAAMVAASGAIGRFFQHDDLPQVIVSMSALLYLHACSVTPSALLIREFRFYDTAQAAIASELAGGIVGVVCAFTGRGVWSLVAQRLAAALVRGVILWAKARWRPRLRWSIRRLQDLWKFSVSRGLEGLLLYIDQQLPRIILGRVAGVGELGYFVFARRVVENSVMVLHQPIRAAALPMFARIQNEPERVRRAYEEGVALSSSIIFPACTGLAMVAPVLVPALAGSSWSGAVALLQVLVLNSFRMSFHVWNAALLRGLGKPHLLLWATLLRTLATVALIYVLLGYGAVGVCVAIVAGAVTSWPVAIGFVRQVTGLGPAAQLRPGVVPFAAAVVMAAVLLVIRPLAAASLPPVAALGALIGAGIAVYGASLALLGRTELRRLRGLVRTVWNMRPGAGGASPDEPF